MMTLTPATRTHTMHGSVPRREMREDNLGYAKNVFLHKQQVVWVVTVTVHL